MFDSYADKEILSEILPKFHNMAWKNGAFSYFMAFKLKSRSTSERSRYAILQSQSLVIFFSTLHNSSLFVLDLKICLDCLHTLSLKFWFYWALFLDQIVNVKLSLWDWQAKEESALLRAELRRAKKSKLEADR